MQHGAGTQGSRSRSSPMTRAATVIPHLDNSLASVVLAGSNIPGK